MPIPAFVTNEWRPRAVVVGVLVALALLVCYQCVSCS
jgi:hypothetical protein